MSFQRLVILRGPMGSGKTTIANHLKNFDAKIACLHVDQFKNIFDHFEKEARVISQGAMLASLKFLLDEGYSVVIEGVLQNVKVVQEAIGIAAINNVPSNVFELTASLDTLVFRDKNRAEVNQGWREPLGADVIKQIRNKLENSQIPNSIKIDTQNKSVEEIIKIIDSEFKNIH